MQTEPNIESRPEQPYVGIRKIMPMKDFAIEIPVLIERVSSWLRTNSLKSVGKPFLRYHVIDMPERMDVEVGMTTAKPVPDSRLVHAPVNSNLLPAGRYAVMIYRGLSNGVATNKKLMQWVVDHDAEVVSHDSENGEVFKCRYETFVTDASTEPDKEKWDTQIAMKLRD